MYLANIKWQLIELHYVMYFGIDSTPQYTFHKALMTVDIEEVKKQVKAELDSMGEHWEPMVRILDNEHTCSSCPSAHLCSLAFDDYNTDGDCLAIK